MANSADPDELSEYSLFGFERVKVIHVEPLTLLHSERPKLHIILAFLSAIELLVYNFGLSECSRVNCIQFWLFECDRVKCQKGDNKIYICKILKNALSKILI